MSHHHHHKQQSLLLISCALGFVYLLAWQFQSDRVMEIVQGTSNYMPIIETTGTILSHDLDTSDTDITTTPGTQTTTSSLNTMKLTALNALPQSFTKLGLGQTQKVYVDDRQIIISNEVGNIKRSGDSKQFVAPQTTDLGINVEEIVFYNDESWTNILVVMQITRNNMSFIMQIPYRIWRDDKKYINQLIDQLIG